MSYATEHLQPSVQLAEGESFERFLAASRQAYAQPVSLPRDQTTLSESAPYTASISTQKIGVTCLRYVLWTHNSESAQHVAPLLTGCDILAHELIYKPLVPRCDEYGSLSEEDALLATREMRDHFAQLSIAMQSKDTTDDVLEPLANAALGLHTEEDQQEAIRHGTGHAGLKKIYEACKGKVEAIEHLDITPLEMNQLHELAYLADVARLRVLRTRRMGGSWAMLCEDIVNEAAAIVNTVTLREHIFQERTTQLIRQYPNRTIAILYGRAHQLVTRMQQDNDVVMQRLFVKEESPRAPRLERITKLVLWDLLRLDFTALPIREIQDLMLLELCPYKLHDALSDLSPEARSLLVYRVSTLWRTAIDADNEDGRARIRARETATRALFESYLNQSSTRNITSTPLS